MISPWVPDQVRHDGANRISGRPGISAGGGFAFVSTAKLEPGVAVFGEINADEAFRKQMLDGGFALLDVDSAGMADFMKARKDEYIEAATEAGLLN